MTEPDVVSLLQTTKLFHNVPRDMLLKHLGVIDQNTLAEHEILLAPGQENDCVFIIISGRLRIHLDLTHSIPLAIFGPGECVGEMSIIDDAKVSAYVIADIECKLFSINQAAIWSLIDHSFEASRNLLHVLSKRMQSNNKILSDSISKQQQYERYANVDELTGLHNRRWMNDTFKRQILRCSTQKEPSSLIMIDADRFKQFNDVHGHLGGDQALRTIAQTMMRSLRPNDQIARYGGEEFIALLPQTTLKDAVNVANRLRQQVSRADIIMSDGTPLPSITVSLGVSEAIAGDSLEEVIARADAALYRAKQSGRDCVSI